MKRQFLPFLLVTLCCLGTSAKAQFHTLNLPSLSPKASVSQQVGVSTVSIDYSSPSVRGRDVWNDPGVIPQNGEPFAWRAGANINTTISFDTDVFIEGQALPAGKYGFHILPNQHQHTLVFASRNNLWGSYYLNQKEDVVLKVAVKDTSAAFSEHLTYHFGQRTDSSTTVFLSWGDRQIPFTVSVDLNRTTIERLRRDLNGENTYRWEAWNDAAYWCLSRNTNLEEALSWANRSINGGFGGFAANKNLVNLAIKLRILSALGREQEVNEGIQEGFSLDFTLDEARSFTPMLLQLKKDKEATEFTSLALQRIPDNWVMYLYQGIGFYYQGQSKKAETALKKCAQHCPDFFHVRLAQIKELMQEGKYQFPGRS